MPSQKHDWNNLQNYLHVHEKVLKKYSACFSNQPAYKLERPTDQWLELSATLHFQHKGIKLEIDKTAEVQCPVRARSTGLRPEFKIGLLSIGA